MPKPMKRRQKRKLFVDLTQDIDESVAANARSKNDGKKVLRKKKGSTSLSNMNVHIDNNLTEMRNLRNAQARYPDFFGNPDWVVELECISVVSFKPNTKLTDLAVIGWLQKSMESSATEVVISELDSAYFLVLFY